MSASSKYDDRRTIRMQSLFGALLVALVTLGGCDGDDCVNCVQEPPVVPTGVHSISGDGYITVQWYDISYYPYDGKYNPNVTTYVVYSRYYEAGDEYDPDREFDVIGEVAWDENFDAGTGLHWFDDILTPEILAGGRRFEYAVSAVNASGIESALSYELVIDSPVEMGLEPVTIYGAVSSSDTYAVVSAFDFSDLRSQPVNPWAASPTHDIRFYFQSAVPYVEAAAGVKIQDYGMFVDTDGYLIFEGVGWAPTDYYSSTGVLEVVLGHIYVLEITDGAEVHYAKFQVSDITDESVDIIWAYQTIAGLPELKAPPEREPGTENRQISL